MEGDGENIPPARPHIVVTLPSLVEQWYFELRKMSIKFNIVRYHGPVVHSGIKAVLTQDSQHFNGDEKNIWTVFVTTPMTLSSRHGPTGLYDWRIKKKVPVCTSNVATFLKKQGVPDSKWPLDLSGKFGFCLIDEAQTVKNPSSASHQSCKWLVPGFYVLATATPDVNSVTDIRGYVPFIVPQTAGFSSNAHLQQLGMTVNDNPYDLDDKHPGAILRLHCDFFDKFINHESVTEPIVIGKRLRKYYQQCMIRRTFISRVDGKQILEDLPPLRHRRAECTLRPHELEAYRTYAKVPMKKLVHVHPFTRKLTWNWKHYRFLLLISTWTGFASIEHRFMATDIPKLLKEVDLLGKICE